MTGPLALDSTPLDQMRVSRVVLAWHSGNVEALNAVLAEADSEPGGVAALIFGLANLASHLGDLITEDRERTEQMITAALLRLSDQDEHGDGG